MALTHTPPAVLGGARSLDQLAPGEGGRVACLDGPPASIRRLMLIGLRPQTTVRLLRRAPLGDPLQVAVGDALVSIRASEASRIFVGEGP